MLEEQHAHQANAVRQALIAEVRKAYVGPEEVPEMLLTALLARGHALVEGVPGVAKTTLAKTFARTLGCSFRRIQFTPDLLPADITGTYVLDMRDNTFVLREGPVFANIVLGDEINRAPAKSQSALLEAMQESQVTIEGHTRTLAPPFMVLATQNPIEQAGTYPLPEAQIDRFVVRLLIGYPEPADELAMLKTYNQSPSQVGPVLTPQQILDLQAQADLVHIDSELIDFIIRLARYTREHAHVYLGASPRASLMLLRCAKARALLHGRVFVLPDDVKSLAVAVLAHRILLAPEAEMEQVSADQLVNEALTRVRYQRRR